MRSQRAGLLLVGTLLTTGLVLMAWGAHTHASTGAPGTTAPQASPTATGTPVGRAPVVTQLRATLSVPVTTYSVTASDPDGGTLTYEWIMAGEACGTPRVPWTQRGASVRWSHGDEPPDSCKHLGVDHDVVASVTITTSRGVSVQCVIVGSAPVEIRNPECRSGTFMGDERQTATPVPSATPPPPVPSATPPPPPASTVVGAQTSEPGTFDREVLNVGVNTAVWNGGTILELSNAVTDAGGISVTVFVFGEPRVLIPGAPEFVNAGFNAVFPTGTVPAGTIVLVVK